MTHQLIATSQSAYHMINHQLMIKRSISYHLIRRLKASSAVEILTVKMGMAHKNQLHKAAILSICKL